MAEKSRETYTRARRPIVAGVAVVAMVARQGETYTCTGRPMVAGVAVHGCEKLRDLYVYWETYGCRGCCGCEKLRDLYVYWESY